MIPAHLDFRSLKRGVSIEQVLADKRLLERMRRRGDQIVGPCPVHHGDNPNAFVVDRRKNLWHCFTGCGGGGDVVELARRLSGGSYRVAAHYLATLVDLPPPAWGMTTPPARPFRPYTKRLFLDPRTPWLKQKGIRPQIAQRFQVGAFYGHGFLAGCVAVRLFDPEGRPLGYAGRRLDAEQARAWGKWRLPRGLPRNTLLYGYHQAAGLRRGGGVLVECPWGVLRLAQLGIPAVALLGTHLSPVQRKLLHDLPRVVVLMDGDEAGRNAARAVSMQLANTVAVHLPDGLDPDDLSDQQLARLRGHFLL
ncbi:MAG: hypothetical protein GY719_02030 [bacterium]|nr:hypothetical protein [bacterium]